MVERPWGIIGYKGGWIIIPKEKIYCPICGEQLLFHDYLVQHSNQGWYHADVHMKCYICGFYATFGIPISKEEFEILFNSKWHRKIIDKDIPELYSDIDEVKERLERWGYW